MWHQCNEINMLEINVLVNADTNHLKYTTKKILLSLVDIANRFFLSQIDYFAQLLSHFTYYGSGISSNSIQCTYIPLMREQIITTFYICQLIQTLNHVRLLKVKELKQTSATVKHVYLDEQSE